MKIQFEEAEFEQLCPCYLLLNRELAIVKWGSGFNAYKHSFKANDPADHHFSFTASPLQNLITQAQSTQKKVSIDGLMLSSASAYFKGLLWIENAGDTVFVALVPSTATCLAEKQIHEIPVPYFLKKEQNIQNNSPTSRYNINYEKAELWRFIMEETGHGLWVNHLDRGELEFSSKFKALLGYNEEDHFDADTWRKSLSDEDRAHFYANIFPNITYENSSFVFETKLTTKSGEIKYYLSKGLMAEWTEDKKPKRALGTIVDITDRVIRDINLKHTTQSLISLLKNLNEGVLLLNEEQKIMLANEAFTRLFALNVSPTALEGKTKWEVFPDGGKSLFKHPEEYDNRLQTIINNKEKVIGERLVLANGEIIERDYIPIFLDNNYAGYLWKYNKITERLAYEKQLQAQKDFYETIFNELPANIAIYSPDGEEVFNNNSEFNAQATIQQQQPTILPLTKSAAWQHSFTKAVANLQAQKYVDEVGANSAKPHYILRHFYPYINNDNVLQLIITYAVDITEQIRNEQYAEQQEERIKHLLDIIKDAVVRCDKQGNINLDNTAFRLLMGLPLQNEALPNPLNFFSLLPPDAFKIIEQKVADLVQTTIPQTGTFYLDVANGEGKYIEYTLTLPGKAEDAAFIVRLSDITAIVLKEQNLEKIIAKEKELNRAKSQFVRITSHELRTPLSVIMLNAEILEMATNTGKIKDPAFNIDKVVGRVIKEVNLMTEILDQLMMISRIEAGNIYCNPTRVNLYDYFSAIKQELFTPYSDGRVLNMICANKAAFGKFDKALIRHAIVNLLNNAFKYSPGKPSPEFSISSVDNTTILEIKDYGIGIPEAEMDKLYDSFFRASNVGAISGTGIGLMVVDYSIKLHKGSIKVDSTLHKGTTFTITLNS